MKLEYTINKLANLAGISVRTLRYYDELELLTPNRNHLNDYRIYGQSEVDRLQQILFYRELGVPLEEIKRILSAEDFDHANALKNHLNALLCKRSQLDLLIKNVRKTITSIEGRSIMNDKEKFDGFIQNLTDDNEQMYGTEIREKYGDDTINRSNKKIKSMTKEEYHDMEELSSQLNSTLKSAFEQGDSSSELAQKVCKLHKKWLGFFWKNYSKEAHIGVTQMYVDDPRFTEYYDQIAPGCAEFLRDAVLIYCK